MKTLFHYSSHGCQASALEITETEILSRDKKQNHQYPLPRFISQFETKSHRGFNNLGKIKSTPKVCRINSEKAEEMMDLIVNISKYPDRDRSAKQRHLESIRRNLEHRLQVAKSEDNDFLVNLLDHEFKELITSI
jgi:hypothetical protein